MADISKIDMNRINGLLDKLDEVTNKINSMKYVIESYQNGTTWYRIWSDGWVEQGGVTSNISWNGSGADENITLPIEMKDVNYSLIATMSNTTGNWNYPVCRAIISSSTTIKIGIASAGSSSQGTAKCIWEVKGYKK